MLYSVLAPYPVGYDNPVADGGKSLAAPVRRTLVPVLALATLPTAGIVAAGHVLAMPVLQWTGVATGASRRLARGKRGVAAAAGDGARDPRHPAGRAHLIMYASGRT